MRRLTGHLVFSLAVVTLTSLGTLKFWGMEASARDDVYLCALSPDPNGNTTISYEIGSDDLDYVVDVQCTGNNNSPCNYCLVLGLWLNGSIVYANCWSDTLACGSDGSSIGDLNNVEATYPGQGTYYAQISVFSGTCEEPSSYLWSAYTAWVH
jgi:hypothetical protein